MQGLVRVRAGEVDGEERGDKIINMIWAYLPCCVHHGGIGDLGRVEGGGGAEQHDATVATGAVGSLAGAAATPPVHQLI